MCNRFDPRIAHTFFSVPFTLYYTNSVYIRSYKVNTKWGRAEQVKIGLQNQNIINIKQLLKIILILLIGTLLIQH